MHVRDKERADKLRALLAGAVVLRKALEAQGYTVEIGESLTGVKISRTVEQSL